MSVIKEHGHAGIPTGTRQNESKSVTIGSQLQSTWFCVAVVLAVTCGPLLIPGVGLRELFIGLIGGSTGLYLLLILAGVVVSLRDGRRSRSRTANR